MLSDLGFAAERRSCATETEKGGSRIIGATLPVVPSIHLEAPNRCKSVISFANGFLIEEIARHIIVRPRENRGSVVVAASTNDENLPETPGVVAAAGASGNISIFRDPCAIRKDDETAAR